MPGLIGSQPLPRAPLGGYQDQALFGDGGGHRAADETTSEYFQYSPFAVSMTLFAADNSDVDGAQ